MDVQGEVAVVVVQQVFAVRLGVAQRAAVEQRRPRREPALRAADRDPPAGEQLPVAGGEAVDGVSLWHGTQR